MSVDVMRFIDYYVGVPLCFLAGIWLKFVRLLQKGRKGPAKRTVFLQLSEMGSAIVGDSALRWLRNQNVEIFYAIFERNAASLRMVGTVAQDHIYLIREKSPLLFAFDTFRFFIWCRVRRIDSAIDFELFSRYSALLSAFSGARERVGFDSFHAEGLYRGDILTRRVAYNPHIHIAKNFMALVKSLMASEPDLPYFKGGISDEEIQPQKIAVNESAKLRVRAKLKELGTADVDQVKWVILNCAGGEFLPQRRWPQVHFAKLGQLILDQNPDAHILLTGSPSEALEVEPIRILTARDRCHNFAGRIAFEHLTSLYTFCRLMVSNDSGPAHFASLTETPTYVFFGPETPALYGSLGNFTPLYANFACSPCVSAFNHRKTPCQDNKCLQVISPETVYSKIAQHLM